MLLAIIAIMVFMSELTSNTAQVATMLPILAALAPVLRIPAGVLLVPATIAASCAFMMPVGTPPNAIVFGTGLVRMPQMMKAGIWLNLTGILLIFALTFPSSSRCCAPCGAESQTLLPLRSTWR